MKHVMDRKGGGCGAITTEIIKELFRDVSQHLI